MALLDAVVFPRQPQGHQHFAYGHRGYSPSGLPWSGGDDGTGAAAAACASEWDPLLLASLVQNAEEWEDEAAGCKMDSPEREATAAPPPAPVTPTIRRKRRRTAKAVRNEEEIESQRMTHIAVERNRRRQMNEYLAALRSLMPPSYAHRGDQASIVGGAINYVRELEHLVQSLEVQKGLKRRTANPFAGFFSFPQYSTVHTADPELIAAGGSPGSPSSAAAATDIEASMVEGYASVKVQAPRRAGQLLRLAAGLQRLGLTTLHLNVSSAGAMAMYSFSLKVEDDCKLSSVEEVADAVHQILGGAQEQAGFS